MVGLSKNSTIQEIFEKKDDNTLIKYSIRKEEIDLGALKIEKRGIEEQLRRVLTDEELLEWARKNYPQPENINQLKERLEEINLLLLK